MVPERQRVCRGSIGSIDDISSTDINGDIVQANRLATAPPLGSPKHFAGTRRARNVGQQSRGSQWAKFSIKTWPRDRLRGL